MCGVNIPWPTQAWIIMLIFKFLACSQTPVGLFAMTQAPGLTHARPNFSIDFTDRMPPAYKTPFTQACY